MQMQRTVRQQNLATQPQCSTNVLQDLAVPVRKGVYSNVPRLRQPLPHHQPMLPTVLRMNLPTFYSRPM